MKSVKWLVAASVFVLALNRPVEGAEESARPSVRQWEYRVLRIDSRRPEEVGRTPGVRSGNAEAILNELGAEGWELVSVRNDNQSTTAAPIFYFKRLKP